MSFSEELPEAERKTPSPKLSLSDADCEIYAEAKISVWWDKDSSELPPDADATFVANNISRLLDDFGFCGPIVIRSFSDVKKKVLEQKKKMNEILKKKRAKRKLNPEYNDDEEEYVADTIKDLDCTAVRLVYVPQDESTCEKMTAAMKDWMRNNREPSVYLLITSDNGFSHRLKYLKKHGHMTLLARPKDGKFPSDLYPHCKFVWDWDTVATHPATAKPLNSKQKDEETEKSNVEV